MPTIMLNVHDVRLPSAIAAGRGALSNSSDAMKNAIGPRPNSKQKINASTATILAYGIQCAKCYKMRNCLLKILYNIYLACRLTIILIITATIDKNMPLKKVELKIMDRRLYFPIMNGVKDAVAKLTQPITTLTHFALPVLRPANSNMDTE